MLTDLHMHSKYSDGLNTPEEMIEAAIRIGYEAVAITDHVWKTSDWVPQYAAHLNELKRRYADKLTVYSGVEAKVLDLKGDIDADPSFDKRVDLLLGSIHRIPRPEGFYSRVDAERLPRARIVDHWLQAFYGLLQNPRVDIIAHPLAELKGFGIGSDVLPVRELADAIAASGKLLECNVRYNRPDEPVIRLAAEQGVPILVSSDSHTVDDLIKNSSLVKEISARGFPAVDIVEYLKNK